MPSRERPVVVSSRHALDRYFYDCALKDGKRQFLQRTKNVKKAWPTLTGILSQEVLRCMWLSFTGSDLDPKSLCRSAAKVAEIFVIDGSVWKWRCFGQNLCFRNSWKLWRIRMPWQAANKKQHKKKKKKKKSPSIHVSHLGGSQICREFRTLDAPLENPQEPPRPLKAPTTDQTNSVIGPAFSFILCSPAGPESPENVKAANMHGGLNGPTSTTFFSPSPNTVSAPAAPRHQNP